MRTVHAKHHLPSLQQAGILPGNYCKKNSAQSKTATHRHKQLYLLLSCFTVVILGEKGCFVLCVSIPSPRPCVSPPPSFAQNCLQAAEEACEQSDHPQSARHTPCPYSWAVYSVFPAVRKQVIQVQSLKLGCLPLTSQCKYYFISLTFKRNGKTFHPSNT